MAIGDIVKLARPGHWIKNVFVLMPVVFGMRMAESEAWINAGIATLAFCLASSFAYIINDIKDAESDRLHPRKKNRPIASGKISVKAGFVEAFVLLVASAGIAYSVSVPLLIMVVVYVLLQVLYSELLKRKILLDVICIAIGFVLRAVAGAIAIGVEISPWLFVCMFTLCMFLGFCKRYNEVVTLGDVTVAGNHRATLLEYTPDLLTHLITISAGIAVIGFLLYSLNVRTVEHFGTDYLVYTLPVVVYAIFRFAMLSMKGVYSDPTDVILHDRAFQATVVVWLVMAMSIISYGPRLQRWFESFSG